MKVPAVHPSLIPTAPARQADTGVPAFTAALDAATRARTLDAAQPVANLASSPRPARSAEPPAARPARTSPPSNGAAGSQPPAATPSTSAWLLAGTAEPADLANAVTISQAARGFVKPGAGSELDPRPAPAPLPGDGTEPMKVDRIEAIAMSLGGSGQAAPQGMNPGGRAPQGRQPGMPQAESLGSS